MVSILQGLGVLTWLVLVMVAVLFIAPNHGSGWPWAALVVLVVGHAIVLGIEFVLMAHVNNGVGGGHATRAERWRAWWAETLQAPLVFGWRQPFRSRRWPDLAHPTRPGQRGVVLVHGFMCNRGLWHGWLKRLHRERVPFIAVDLEPLWGPIERYAPAIDDAVSRIRAHTGLAPVLVGHSMGGLAIRYWWQTAPVDHAHHVITLGSPHHGTWLARWGHLPNVRQMRHRSPWLQRLAGTESAERRQRMTCFYSPCDNIVFPAGTATLPDANNRMLRGVGHVHMVTQPEPWAELLHRLAAHPGSPASASTR